MPSKRTREQKQLKNEIRALIKSLPYRPPFIIYEGATYDLPDSEDLCVISKSILEQIRRK